MKYSTKLKDANNILAVQGTKDNYDQGEYMRGLYNGMEMIIAIFEEREPIFKDYVVSKEIDKMRRINEND